jgi:amino acid transporter
MAEKGVFVRSASGLVRAMSPIDTMLYNWLTMTIFGTALYVVIWGPLTFPGGNVILAGVLTAVLGAPGFIAVAMLACSMPRSGGDYLFSSRILHPAIGFGINFSCMVVWMGFWNTLAGEQLSSMAFNPLLTYFGLATNSESLINIAAWCVSTDGKVIITLVHLALVYVILVKGLKVYLWIQNYLMVPIVLAAIAIVAFVFMSSSHGQFVQSFNSFMMPYAKNPDYYSYIMQTAKNAGYSGIAPFSLYDTMGMIAIAWGALMWASWGVQQLGEIKHAGFLRSQLIAIIGALVMACVSFIIVAGTTFATVGQDFLGSVGYLVVNQPDALVWQVRPNVFYYAAMLAPHWILVAIISLGFWMSIFQIYCNSTLGGTRLLIAQAFDQVLPKYLAKVNKAGSPTGALNFLMVVSIFYILIYNYWPNFYGYTLSIAAANVVGFLFGSYSSSVLFPYRMKEVYNRSPIAKYKIGNVPLITILGTWGCGWLICILYIYFTTPALGIVAPPSLALIFGLIVISFVIYYVAKWYRSTKGIDLSLTFKEIPPD